MLCVALWRRNLVNLALLQSAQVTKRLVVEIVDVLVNYFNSVAYRLWQVGYGGDSGIAKERKNKSTREEAAKI